MPKVSVIIPTYGEPELLSHAVDSVLNQTFSDLELILVDDNNPNTQAREKTEDFAGSVTDERFKYIKHERNKNGAAARNTGLSVATGEYIAFLDSDDEYMPDRIEKCIAVLEKDKSVMGVYTGCEFRRSLETYRVFTKVVSGNFLKETLSSTFMFCTGSNIFMRRSVIDELSGFDEKFLRHQDYEFLVRYFEKYDLVAIPEVLVVKNNDNKNLPNPDKMRDIKEQYLNKYKYILDAMEDSDDVYKMQNILIAEGYMAVGNIKEANKFYKVAKQFGKIPFMRKIRRTAFFIKGIKR